MRAKEGGILGRECRTVEGDARKADVLRTLNSYWEGFEHLE